MLLSCFQTGGGGLLASSEAEVTAGLLRGLGNYFSREVVLAQELDGEMTFCAPERQDISGGPFHKAVLIQDVYPLGAGRKRGTLKAGHLRGVDRCGILQRHKQGGGKKPKGNEAPSACQGGGGRPLVGGPGAQPPVVGPREGSWGGREARLSPQPPGLTGERLYLREIDVGAGSGLYPVPISDQGAVPRGRGL